MCGRSSALRSRCYDLKSLWRYQIVSGIIAGPISVALSALVQSAIVQVGRASKCRQWLAAAGVQPLSPCCPVFDGRREDRGVPNSSRLSSYDAAPAMLIRFQSVRSSLLQIFETPPTLDFL
jgi:hypothetical protein